MLHRKSLTKLMIYSATCRTQHADIVFGGVSNDKLHFCFANGRSWPKRSLITDRGHAITCEIVSPWITIAVGMASVVQNGIAGMPTNRETKIVIPFRG